ncbi:MAG: N-acetyl-gamma-glutamyl-phosphate reductase, partial [Planctomycetota bacterium]|nr:N-acetyl-gamma-glutamyl-phosphate reductase [Planctomycetota bacterium]
PMDRGILATIYVKPISGVTEKHINDAWQQSYGKEHFVRLVDHLPGTKDTVDTNFCDLTARMVRGRIILISCLDNLVKGASGAAVQNMNCMHALPETTGLL